MKQIAWTLPAPGVSRPGYWKLVAAGEPYRLLFAVGACLGVFGVFLWPAYVWGLIDWYPGQIHARIMIEGFLSCFVIGFLGTAFPRLLGVRRFSMEESLSWTVALLAACGFHLAGNTLWGDYLFTLSFALLLGGLLARFRGRRDTPPPGFVLVLMGLLSAILGGAGQVAAQLWPEGIAPGLAAFSKLLLYQGFLLLPVMGIGAFLIPRFFGLPNRQDFPESRTLPPGWIWRAVLAACCGLLVVGSFALEAAGDVRLGLMARAFAIVLYFYQEVPVHRTRFNQGALALAMRLSLYSIPLGYALMAIWPDRQATFIHVVFISGFSLLTFTVASRVILGHSGRSPLFGKHLGSVYALAGLLALAMVTRVSADWLPHIRDSHLGYAAGAWLIGVLIWAARFLPCLRDEDAE